MEATSRVKDLRIGKGFIVFGVSSSTEASYCGIDEEDK